jgi:hypothetical protein
VNYDDDLDAVATLGWGPEVFDKLAASGVAPGAFAEFRSLDVETRALVLRLLDSPTEADFAELQSHPASRAVAGWLLTLPAYVNAPEGEDDA